MNDAILLAGDDRAFEEWVRLAFAGYRDLSALVRSPLADSSLVETCLLEGDKDYQESRGYALRATLRWVLEKLRAKGTVQLEQSYDVLLKRYVEGMSAARYADLMVVSHVTAQSRRRSAIRRAAGILRQELKTPTETAQRKRQMIGLRYGDCSEDRQKALRFLAVFRKPVPVNIQAPLDKVAFHSGVLRLLGVNLLASDEAVREVSVHPEIRPYLLTQLTPGERSEWEQMVAAYYQQQGNVLEAVYHWQMAGCAEVAAALLIARRRESGEETMPVEPLRERLAAFRRSDLPLDTWAQLKILAGRAEELAGQLEAALRVYREALGAEDKGIKAEAYYRLGRVYRQTDLDAALTHFGHSKRLLADTAHPDQYELLAKVCISEAWIFIDHRPDAGQIEENLARAEKALPYGAEKERLILLSDLYNARAAALHTFRRQEATQYQEKYIEYRWRAWHYAQEARDLVRMMNTGHNLGMAYMRQGQYQAARPLFRESHELAEQLGNRRMVAVNNKALGNWFVLSASDYEQAIPHLALAYEGLREMENQFHLAAVCYDLAEAYALSGQGVAGKSYYDEGVRIARALGNEPLQGALAALAQQCPELALALNDRQQQAVGFMRANGAITNQEYRDLTDVSPRTAARDLNELVMAGICEQVGQGRTTHYQLAHKQSS